MPLKRRGNVWWFDERIGGRRIRVSLGTTRRREAERRAEEQRAQAGRSTGLTLRGAADAWLGEHAIDWQPRTIAQYQAVAGKIVRDLGDPFLDELAPIREKDHTG